ncbi:MAG: efflux RND transporter periplasmic adaptor subunit [Aureliella sp.]
MKHWKFGLVAAASLLMGAAEVSAQNAPPQSTPLQSTPAQSALRQVAPAGSASANPAVPGTAGTSAGSAGSSTLGGSSSGGYGSPRVFTPGSTITGLRAAIKCIYDVQLAAQADGLIQELLVVEGTAVEKGQLILTIDERLATAELGVAQKEAEAAAAQASQDANLRFSRKAAEVADQEYLESKELYERNSASLQETRRKQLEAQKARLGIEVAEVDHAKDILAAGVAKEKVAAAKVQLELRKVTAPYDGIIATRMRSQGEWVKAGEPVVRMMHMKEMKVEAHVEVAGASVSHLQNAIMFLHVNINGETLTYKSKIEFVSPSIELNTCRIWARVPNEFIAGTWMLRDGMEATIDIQFPPAQPVSTQNAKPAQAPQPAVR